MIHTEKSVASWGELKKQTQKNGSEMETPRKRFSTWEFHFFSHLFSTAWHIFRVTCTVTEVTLETPAIGHFIWICHIIISDRTLIWESPQSSHFYIIHIFAGLFQEALEMQKYENSVGEGLKVQNDSQAVVLENIFSNFKISTQG